jgi:hypothetical protein
MTRRAVQEGANEIITIDGDRVGIKLHFFDDGAVRFEHRCKIVYDEVLVCSPLLRTGEWGSGHAVERTEHGVNVTPSILCPDCLIHGFIHNSVWREA